MCPKEFRKLPDNSPGHRQNLRKGRTPVLRFVAEGIVDSLRAASPVAANRACCCLPPAWRYAESERFSGASMISE